MQLGRHLRVVFVDFTCVRVWLLWVCMCLSRHVGGGCVTWVHVGGYDVGELHFRCACGLSISPCPPLQSSMLRFPIVVCVVSVGVSVC